MKTCGKCKQKKSLDLFSNNRTSKDGKSNTCKLCFSTFYKSNSEYKKQYYLNNLNAIRDNQKKYYKNNKEFVSKICKKYRELNSEKLKEAKKKYYETNKEKILSTVKKYRENNKEKLKTVERVKRKKARTNPLNRLKDNLRRRIHKALKGEAKSQKTLNILGCSWLDLKTNLETKFLSGMTWENYGKLWHVDHIVPLASAKNEKEVYKLNHFSNLQPLWAKDNIKKGAKFV